MPDSVTYEFSWPPASLSPNTSVHWAKLAKAKREYKDECGWYILSATGEAGQAAHLSPPVTAQVTFHCDGRRRDADNHMAMLKPLFDALVEMGVLVDDNKDVLTILDPKWERGAKKIVVELTGSVVECSR